MSILHLPVELSQEIGAYLTAEDVLALVRVSKQLYAHFIQCLYRLAQHYKGARHTLLTKGLTEVTFWYDKESSGSAIEWAVVHGEYFTFEQLISVAGADLLQADTFGVTLLHRISAQGLVQYMGPLINRLKAVQVDPFQTDHSLLTPLHYAAGRGMTAAVDLLIAAGAQVSVKDHHGNTPLHLAAVAGSVEVLAPLVQAGCTVSAKSRFGWLPIDQASVSQHNKAVRELMRLGSRPPDWNHRARAIDEFVKLSPCPLECYKLHLILSS